MELLMNKYNELENLMYAIGRQLYHKDRILYDLFDSRFNHTYVSFGYCSSEEDKIQQLGIINNLMEEFSLIDLIKMAMSHSDYYRLYQLNWWIGNYTEKIKDYKLDCEPIVKLIDIKDAFDKRINKLEDENLNSWRKSDDDILHSHYHWWINNLMNNENYAIWALRYNDTRTFDTFHLSNCGEKIFPKIILQYILDNHIIPDQINKNAEIEIMSPFNNYGTNGYKIKTSSNMGGMWYMIYLTAKEFQEIYKSVGSKKISDMNVRPFFSYVNSLNEGDELNEKFYLYFKK